MPSHHIVTKYANELIRQRSLAGGCNFPGPYPRFHLPLPAAVDYTFNVMYDDFRTKDHWSSQNVHCMFQAVVTAISTRHADAVDIKFLVEGRPVWIALPHAAWGEYNRRTGKIVTDPLAVQVAGHFLKSAIENGEEDGREMYTLTLAETLNHLEAVVQEHATVGAR